MSNNNTDEKYYRKISLDNNVVSPNSYTPDFPKKMADAWIENKIPRYQSISSDQIRKDLDQLSSIRDPIMQTDIIKHIRLDPRVETETIGMTYSPETKDWQHFIKKKG